jgi:hypothetical protein
MSESVRSYPIEALLNRVRSEFVEMPGLRLTIEQAKRLWSLDLETCRHILELLVDCKFLLLGADHKYRRFPAEIMEPRLRMARSNLANRPSFEKRDLSTANRY